MDDTNHTTILRATTTGAECQSGESETEARRKPFIPPDVSLPVAVGSLTLAASGGGNSDGGNNPLGDGTGLDPDQSIDED